MLADPYGYPHAETVAALNAVNAQIHGTDREGTIVATSDGSQVTLAGSRWLPFKP
jgi:beta-lactamase superfamily II metal-dependent hydrolase